MGYHVSITRQRHGVTSPIPLEDWLEHVRTSSDLKFCNPMGDDVQSQFTRSIHAADWKGEGKGWLGWSNGEIWTKNPSEEFVLYMISLAPKFQARVRGDDGRFFDGDGSCHVEKDGRDIPWSQHAQGEIAAIQRRKRKDLFWNCIRIIVMLVVIGLIVLRKMR